MKNITRIIGIVAMIAVTGLSFAACSNGSTDPEGGATIALKWIGTYEDNGDTIVVAAITVITPDSKKYTVRSDEGISGGAHKYNLNPLSGNTLQGLYFYEDKSPVYLTYW